MKAAASTAALAMLVLLSGCSAPEAPPMNYEPHLAEAGHYPLHVGDRRTFRLIATAGATGKRVKYVTETITGTREEDGITYHVRHIDGPEGPEETLLAATDRAVIWWEPAEDLGRRRLILFPFAAVTNLGQPQSARIGAGKDGDGDGKEDALVTVYYQTPVGVESVTTPAGRFAGLRVENLVTRSLVSSSKSDVQRLSEMNELAWYALGTGPVIYDRTFADGSTERLDLAAFAPAAGPRQDTTAPTLLDVTPAAGTPVHAGTPLVLTFDEAVTTSVLSAVTVTDEAGRPVALAQAGPWDPDGRRIVLSTAGWAPGAHTLHIADGIADLSGNAAAAQPDRTFTVDGTRPALVRGLPAAQAEEVTAYDGRLAARFNRAMDPSTASAVLLREGSATLPATVSFADGARQIVVLPSRRLTPSTRYTVDLTGVRDAAGGAVANPLDWTFTTGGTVTVTPGAAPARGPDAAR